MRRPPHGSRLAQVPTSSGPGGAQPIVLLGLIGQPVPGGAMEESHEEAFSGDEDELRQAEEQDQQQPPGTGPYATLHCDGPQMSTGSAGHPDGCMPCTFYCFTRRGCNRGMECRFCHLTHQSKLQQRREAWKKQQREKRKSIRERVAAEALSRRHPSGGASGKGGHGVLEGGDGPGPGPGSFHPGASAVLPGNGARNALGSGKKQSDTPSLVDGNSMPSATAVFTYSPGRAILTIGQEVEFRPQLTARASAFRLSVPLPSGLALDPVSGIISGAPVAPAAKITVVVEAVLSGRSAHAVVDLEVVDFTRGGFVIGHMSEPEPGKFMMLLYVPEEEQAGNEGRQDLVGDRGRGSGRMTAVRKNGVAAKQKGAGVDAAAAMRAMGRTTRLPQQAPGGLPGPGGWSVEEPKSAVAAAAAATPLEWW
mmetsp:Transcript_66997/g.195882  ORF Transcript_66997/g.195882 Transcript_66997/m.195882 type:complete len:422 (-) Transcript_66997:2-1267(-)